MTPLEFRQSLVNIAKDQVTTAIADVNNSINQRDQGFNKMLSSMQQKATTSSFSMVPGNVTFPFDKEFIWGRSIWGVHKIGYSSVVTNQTTRSGVHSRF